MDCNLTDPVYLESFEFASSSTNGRNAFWRVCVSFSCLKKGHKDDQRARRPLLWGKTEQARSFHSGEGLRRTSSQELKRAPERRRRLCLCKEPYREGNGQRVQFALGEVLCRCRKEVLQWELSVTSITSRGAWWNPLHRWFSGCPTRDTRSHLVSLFPQKDGLHDLLRSLSTWTVVWFYSLCKTNYEASCSFEQNLEEWRACRFTSCYLSA